MDSEFSINSPGFICAIYVKFTVPQNHDFYPFTLDINFQIVGKSKYKNRNIKWTIFVSFAII